MQLTKRDKNVMGIRRIILDGIYTGLEASITPYSGRKVCRVIRVWDLGNEVSAAAENGVTAAGRAIMNSPVMVQPCGGIFRVSDLMPLRKRNLRTLSVGPKC
jgi:hypothetical protein